MRTPIIHPWVSIGDRQSLLMPTLQMPYQLWLDLT